MLFKYEVHNPPKWSALCNYLPSSDENFLLFEVYIFYLIHFRCMFTTESMEKAQDK